MAKYKLLPGLPLVSPLSLSLISTTVALWSPCHFYNPLFILLPSKNNNTHAWACKTKKPKQNKQTALIVLKFSWKNPGFFMNWPDLSLQLHLQPWSTPWLYLNLTICTMFLYLHAFAHNIFQPITISLSICVTFPNQKYRHLFWYSHGTLQSYICNSTLNNG